MNQRDLILLALRKLGPGWHPSHAVLCEAWQLDPPKLGLDGCPDLHPSDHRFSAAIFGRRGLVCQGLLERDKAGRLQLTDRGASVAGRIYTNGYSTTQRAGRQRTYTIAAPDEPQELTKLLTSDARLKDVSGDYGSITWTDALSFWGCVSTVNGSPRLAIDLTTALLARWRRDGVGDPVSLDQLSRLHEGLRERFGRHLRVMEEREKANGDGQKILRVDA